MLGHDVAGVVTQVGSAVTGFKVGDEVYSRPRGLRIGTFAESIAVDQADVALKPTTLSFAEAGAVPLVALAAWQALVDVAQIKPGQRVLVHAGAGGLGSTVIQVAKHLRAHVATTASTKDLDRVRRFGADEVVDYTQQDFSEVLSGYDVVLDSLGGENLDNLSVADHRSSRDARCLPLRKSEPDRDGRQRCRPYRGGRRHAAPTRRLTPCIRYPEELSTMTAEILAATEHLVLRRMTNDDAAALAAHRSDPVQARYQSWESHTPRQRPGAHRPDAQRPIRPTRRMAPDRHRDQRTAYRRHRGPRRWRQRWLGGPADAQGHGYATEALRTVISLLFTEHDVQID